MDMVVKVKVVTVIKKQNTIYALRSLFQDGR